MTVAVQHILKIVNILKCGYEMTRNFRVWASNKRVRIFPSGGWRIRVKTVRHSVGGKNMQTNTVDVKRCVIPSGHRADFREDQVEE